MGTVVAAANDHCGVLMLSLKCLDGVHFRVIGSVETVEDADLGLSQARPLMLFVGVVGEARILFERKWRIKAEYRAAATIDRPRSGRHSRASSATLLNFDGANMACVV